MRYECYNQNYNKFIVVFSGSEEDFKQIVLYNPDFFFKDEEDFNIKANQIIKFKQIGE